MKVIYFSLEDFEHAAVLTTLSPLPSPPFRAHESGVEISVNKTAREVLHAYSVLASIAVRQSAFQFPVIPNFGLLGTDH